MHYTLVASEWGERPYATGQMVVVGNVLQYGPGTQDGVALVHCSGAGPCEVFMQDNRAFDREGRTVPLFRADSGLPGRDHCLVESKPFWPAVLDVLPAERVREHVLDNAGARPWDRDEIDRRIIAEVRAGGGRIIDSEQEVGGYPRVKPTRAPFDPDQWDLARLTRR